ncbi:potassium channel, subfamily K, member 7 [Denticeps clupeoides]|uniref:Potassium channel domain-containing protein n=1 Tax=Denticeps clupeoides TaxID=299321 RepID=A0AAY4AMI4_9TELE|nr:potassium channel subfamily K member 1-like [Denticeps clupeoides]
MALRRLLRERAFCLLAVGYVLLLALGGLGFMLLERTEESALAAEARGLRARFLREHPCVRARALDALARRALHAGGRGVAVLEADGDARNFDFASSLFFVTTFLTTTGYGTTMPLSDSGRLFCILYCMVGIPVTLLLLSCLTRAILPRLSRLPVRLLQTLWGLSHSRAALAYAASLAACTAVLFFLLPAASFCLLEPDWSFLESLYFCFISLSTIGLGDYLPGKNRSLPERRRLEFATSCYLVVGLVVLFVVLETFWELPQVQALVRLFAGPRSMDLKGLDLGEMVFECGPASPASPEESAQYALPISTISSCAPERPPLAALPPPLQTGPTE